MSERRPETKIRGSDKCAICGKLQDAKFKPFCSRRCADVDLGRWLKGSYSIPGEKPSTGALPGDDDSET